jgi:hypothetical protein
MNKPKNSGKTAGQVSLLPLRRILSTFAIVLLLGAAVSNQAQTEITQAQAVSRVRTILRNNTSACHINKINSVTAVRVKAGWRVTARITMSASGSPQRETAVWLVSRRTGSVAQDQLTAEIVMGCP